MIALRWAQPAERDEVQAYLHACMGKVPFERWRNILDCRWTPGEERYGAVVRRNGELGGFLGIVFADRTIGGMPARTGNITSWFLERDLRRGGLGQEMLALVTSLLHVTYTATSPNVRSGSLLAKVGWQVMEDKRLYWNRSGKPASARIVPLGTLDEAAQASGLDEGEHRLLADHRGLKASAHVLDAGGEGRCLIVSYVKLKGEDVAHHEVLHCGNRALFSRHVQAYADAVLPEGKAVLSLDSRFVVPGTVAEREEPIAVSRYFRPSGLEAADVDFLYSEVLLLDLKLY